MRTQGVFDSTAPRVLGPTYDMQIDLTNTANAGTFTITPRGGAAVSKVVQARSTYVVSGKDIASVAIGTADSGAAWTADVAGSFGPSGAGVTGTVAAVVTNTPTVDSSVQRTFVTPVSDAFVPTKDGAIEFVASVTDSNGVSINDGTNTVALYPLSGAAAANRGATYRVPCKANLTYTLSGTGILLVGGGVTVE